MNIVFKSQSEERPLEQVRRRTALHICGAALAALTGIMALMSPDLAKEVDPAQAPYLEFIALYVASGVLFLVAFWIVYKDRKGWSIAAIIAPGLIMRLFMVTSTPIIEDDFYRYLWDGVVTASGINPYRYAPLDVMEARGNYPEQLGVLAQEAGSIMEGINHPQIRAVYPPVAQAVLAGVHMVAPWSVVALRVAMLAFDAAAAFIVFLLLRRFALPKSFLLIYWWNPIIVKELINACHMDAIVLPMVAGALLLTLHQRHLWAVLLLTVAGGVKIWPVIFVPLVLRPLLTGPKKDLKTVFTGLIIGLGLAGLFFYPVYTGKLGGSSGFTKYTLLWQNNDGLFRLTLLFVAELASKFDKSLYAATQYTRLVIGGIYLIWLALLCVFPARDRGHMLTKWLLAVAAVFLLSPTQFPWYFSWLVPLLAVRPSAALLVYVVTLPLYYLQYYLPSIGAEETFLGVVVWVEHVPVWGLIAVEAVLARKKRWHNG